MRSFSTTLALALSLVAGAAAAQAQIKVTDPWVRATVPQQKSTGAFMTITSPTDARLVEARSSLTPSVEVHEMAMEKDVMKMRQVDSVALPAGKPVALTPGGFHMMLLDLKQQVKAGDTVPLTLVVEGADGKRQSVEVQAAVRPLNARAVPAAAAGHGDHAHGADHKH